MSTSETNSTKLFTPEKAILAVHELVILLKEVCEILRIIKPPMNANNTNRATYHRLQQRLNQLMEIHPKLFQNLRAAYQESTFRNDVPPSSELLQEKDQLVDKILNIDEELCETMQFLRKIVCEINAMICMGKRVENE